MRKKDEEQIINIFLDLIKRDEESILTQFYEFSFTMVEVKKRKINEKRGVDVFMMMSKN